MDFTKVGNYAYKVKLGNHNIVKRHVDHIHARLCADSLDDWPATAADCNEANSPPPPASPPLPQCSQRNRRPPDRFCSFP